MPRNNINYYSIKVMSGANLPAKLFSQIEKNELFVSPSTHLAGFMKMACIDSPELAKEFKAECEEIFRKRYGDSICLEIVEFTSYETDRSLERTKQRIAQDTMKVREKLESLVLKRR